LSNIPDEFNQLFGAIDWQFPDKVRQEIQLLPEQLAQNEAFSNAARHSDKD
jgi:type I restriction enzyme R subunit